MLRLRDDRQRAFNHARGRFGHVRTDLLLKSIIWHEINALKLSDHVTNDELNEAIQEFERFQDEIAQQGFSIILSFRSFHRSTVKECRKFYYITLSFGNVAFVYEGTLIVCRISEKFQ